MAKTSKIRLQDIAKYTNVSVATVSMALANHPQINDRTKRIIKAASRKLGYNKKSLALTNADTQNNQLRFGYLLIGNRLEDESKMVLAHALAAEAAKINLRFELSAIQNIDDENKLIQEVVSYSGALDGVILSFSRKSDWPLVMELANQKIPFVLIGHLPIRQEQMLPENCELIAYSCLDMGKTAAEYLLEQGHRNIGFISESMPEGMVHDRWWEGYQVALLRSGIIPQPNWTHVAGKIFVGGTEAAKAMFEFGEDRPTAYIIPDIRTAASFIREMSTRGIQITPDCLVMGGEHDVARIYNLQEYPLITINPEDLAYAGLRRLRDLCKWGGHSSIASVVQFEKYNMKKEKTS
jgi:LacI family transcriptional regulator